MTTKTTTKAAVTHTSFMRGLAGRQRLYRGLDVDAASHVNPRRHHQPDGLSVTPARHHDGIAVDGDSVQM